MTTALIVDDEPAIASAVATALEREAITTIHVESLAAARTELQKTDQHIDLIILDVGLPDGSGLDLLRELPANAPDVLVLSARGDELDRVLGLELGADDYMVKPFSPRELVARVRVIIRRQERRKNASTEPRMVAPSFTVDDEAMRIYYHGSALDLSPQEYRLLRSPDRTSRRGVLALAPS